MAEWVSVGWEMIKSIPEIIKSLDKHKEREQDIKMLTLAYERSRQCHWILQPEFGSDEHMALRRLVKNGELIQLPRGMGYSVPGQKYDLFWNGK